MSRTPTNSETANHAFARFLETILELEEATKIYNTNPVQAEEGFNEKATKEFFQQLQTNWEKYQVEQIIDSLVKEVENYKREMYQQEKPLPALPSTGQGSSSISIAGGQSTNNENIELITFASSSSKQEYQTQIIQQPEPIILRTRNNGSS